MCTMGAERLAGALVVALAAVGCAPEEGFAGPTKVAFLRDGTPLVADGYRNARVAFLRRGGGVTSAWGMQGRADGQLDLPHGVAVDADDRVYVADRDNARVQVFERDGRHRATWAGPTIGRPFAVTVVANRVFVVDGGDQDPSHPAARVVVLDRDGRVLGQFGTFGGRAGELSDPHDIAVDARGRVYVAELGTRRVQRFRPGP
jgi:DNA-binding beta-propeller fold protein YncE